MSQFENTFTIIDVWSHTIKALISSFDEDNVMNVIWVWSTPSLAIRKWNILDMEEFKKNIDTALSQAEQMAWEQVSTVYISLSGTSIWVINSNWIIAIPNEEITQDDIDRVLNMAENWVDLSNKTLLKIVPESFSIDLEENIKTPIWMTWKKLEVKAHMFYISSNVLNNIKKWIDDVWVDVLWIYPNIITAQEAVLSRRKKELWSVCIDIWATTTDICVYEEWVMKFASVIPIWWEHVTSDIALWWRVLIDTAEVLKTNYTDVNICKDKELKPEEINLSEINPVETWKIEDKYLSEIARARYEEIFYYVNVELKKIWKDWMLPEWAVIIWWWAKIRWLSTLAKKILRLPVTIWIAENVNNIWWTNLDDPIFVPIIWTTLFIERYWDDTPSWISFNISIKWFIDSIKKLWRKIFS